MRHLISENLIPQHIAAVILTRVLQGLQLHSQHDANQVSILSMHTSKFDANEMLLGIIDNTWSSSV